MFNDVPPCPVPRKQRPAETCSECQAYFTVVGEQCRLQVSGRHRKRACRTPPGFWDMDMPDDEIPIEPCQLSQRVNKYDIVIPPKRPCHPIPSKQGWKRAIKDWEFVADARKKRHATTVIQTTPKSVQTPLAVVPTASTSRATGQHGRGSSQQRGQVVALHTLKKMGVASGGFQRNTPVYNNNKARRVP